MVFCIQYRLRRRLSKITQVTNFYLERVLTLIRKRTNNLTNIDLNPNLLTYFTV